MKFDHQVNIMYLNLKDSSAANLRKAIQANAIFSAASGLLIVVAEPMVLGWLGLEGVGIWPVGVMLIGFSAYLLWMSRNSRVPGTLVQGVIFGDWAWVGGTALLVFLKANLFSGFGLFLLLDVAAIVAILAIMQTRGLRHAQKQPA
jgi:hypothetical protein